MGAFITIGEKLMIKNQFIIEETIGDYTAQLHLPNDCPLGIAHDMVFKMRSYLVERINESLKMDAPKQLEEQEQLQEG